MSRQPKHDTAKRTSAGRRQTLERRAIRAAKYGANR
jgi:hypothetical protein